MTHSDFTGFDEKWLAAYRAKHGIEQQLPISVACNTPVKLAKPLMNKTEIVGLMLLFGRSQYRSRHMALGFCTPNVRGDSLPPQEKTNGQ